jgi:hypothetical protein
VYGFDAMLSVGLTNALGLAAARALLNFGSRGVSAMDLSEIRVGETYIDDRGLEVAVYQIHRTRGVVVLESEDGRFEMTLEDFAQAIEDGDFEESADAGAEDVEEEEDEY